MRRWFLLGGLTLVVVGVLLLEPWALFQDSTVDEAIPRNPPAADAEYGEVAHGMFVSQEHKTTGEARVVQLDGKRKYVRLENFATSNGPDLRIWLSEESAGGNWFKYRNARHIDLGALKANNGNQNYAIPVGADLEGMRSVVIWCKRFFVAFGSAPITSNAPR